MSFVVGIGWYWMAFNACEYIPSRCETADLSGGANRIFPPNEADYHLNNSMQCSTNRGSVGWQLQQLKQRRIMMEVSKVLLGNWKWVVGGGGIKCISFHIRTRHNQN